MKNLKIRLAGQSQGTEPVRFTRRLRGIDSPEISALDGMHSHTLITERKVYGMQILRTGRRYRRDCLDVDLALEEQIQMKPV